jgi:hypothetical protein
VAESLSSSKSLRAGLRAAGKPDRWDNKKRPTNGGYSPELVQEFCVRHAAWQKIRLWMKGKDTTDKLGMLETWWDQHIIDGRVMWATEVQVGNYLGALRRGGQLDNENRIRKAR